MRLKHDWSTKVLIDIRHTEHFDSVPREVKRVSESILSSKFPLFSVYFCNMTHFPVGPILTKQLYLYSYRWLQYDPLCTHTVTLLCKLHLLKGHWSKALWGLSCLTGDFSQKVFSTLNLYCSLEFISQF